MPQQRRITITLPGHAAEALRELSRKEFRDPRRQSTALLIESLRQRGALGEGGLGTTNHQTVSSGGT